MTEESTAQIEGFSLTGAEVAQLEDKTFQIYAEPYYVDVTDQAGTEKKKLIVPVRLANGLELEWYANKTSQKTILTSCGRSLKKWIGYKGEFITKKQAIGKEEKVVIYLKE